MKKLVTILVALAAMLTVAVPAMAVEAPSYTFDMAARMLTDIGWDQQSAEQTRNKETSVGSWFVNVPGHSYLRARFYSVDKNVGGRIELGLKSYNGSATTSLRYAYGYWRVGNCRILAGQTDNWFGSTAYAPKQYLGLNENSHLLMFGWGYLWSGRVPQAQITYSTEQWGIQFAVEQPTSASDTFWEGTIIPAATQDFYYQVPRLSLTGMFRFGAFMTNPGVLWSQHQYEQGDNIGFGENWDTWAIVLPVKFTAGAFTAKFQAHYGQNFWGEFPFYTKDTTSPTVNASGEVEDTIIYGGMISGEYTIGKMMLTAGFGYENYQNDQWSTGGGDDSIERWGAFVAVPYQFTKNFGIHPEFAYYDYDKNSDGTDAGNEWLLGVQFRFIF